MSRAVRFDQYGPVEVLRVDEVERPAPGPGEVLVEVVSAGINPGEIAIREGLLHDRWPADFPSGQGSDFAGRVVEVGDGVRDLAEGDEVVGFTDGRASQADLVVAAVEDLARKPEAVGWDEAGGLKVAGTTAYAAVRAVGLEAGETVAVSGAAGGVGSLVVQLARRSGARVIGIAGETNAEWLRSVGVEPVSYGDGLADRLRAAAPDGIDAFIDTFGNGYLELALGLGVKPGRIETIIDFAGAQRHGTLAVGGGEASTGAVLGELVGLIAEGGLTVPIATTYPLEQVREAYTELARRHTRGKIVLRLR
ncbi:MAG TPA: NADP-dependent oxidoreductase [Pseudonocardia sp.]|jgi:NADPH:quinone reductase-like Zn-dependent oxidoreductase